MIKEVKFKHAIICSLKNNGKETEYIYKSYTNKEQLQRGIDRFEARFYKPQFRTAKLKITIEEVI